MLAIIRFLFSLLTGWKLTPRAERPFQSSTSRSQKSLTLEQPAFVKAFPSLLPLSPSSRPSWFVMRGFPKIGCLSVSAELVGSNLHSPGLTLSQEWRMLFHKEAGGLLSLVVANIQFMSCVFGPSMWIGSLTWLALCLRSSFQGSPPGARPLMRSFANKASDWVCESIIPRPPWEVGRTSISHLTFALALVVFPLHIKFLTTPHTWLHILGFGFQDAARYHMEARSTWFATRILTASKRRQVLQLISFPLSADSILSKLASGGRWKPTWIPRYLTPLPFGIHWSPTSRPYSQSLSLLQAQITHNLFQFIFALDALQKMSKTFWVLSMLSHMPCR